MAACERWTCWRCLWPFFANAETDEAACRVTRYNWPDVIELGDVRLIDASAVAALRMKAPHARWIILTAGSPCQDLSRLNLGRKGLSGERSSLFFEIVRIWELLKEGWREARVIPLVENVASMHVTAREAMSAALSLQPRFAESAAMTHCRRPRLYWSDWELLQGVPCRPSTLGTDVQEVDLPNERGAVERWIKPGWTFPERGDLPTLVRCIPRASAPSDPKGLEAASEETCRLWRKWQHCYATYQFGPQYLLQHPSEERRPPNATERELLMDFAAGHTLPCQRTAARKERPYALEVQRCSLIGNGFQCGTVAWLLAHWAVAQGYLPAIPSFWANAKPKRSDHIPQLGV